MPCVFRDACCVFRLRPLSQGWERGRGGGRYGSSIVTGALKSLKTLVM